LTSLSLTIPNVINSDGPAPTAVRILSVSGGTIYDASGSAISLGSLGTMVSFDSATKVLALKFSPDDNRDTAATLTYAVVDPVVQTLNSAASTVTIPLLAINDLPVLGATSGTYTYVENAAALAVLPSLTVADIDSLLLQQATITLSNASAQDVLSFGTLPTGITRLADSLVSGVLTVQLSAASGASAASFQAALRQLSYSNTSENPSTTARVLNVSVDDDTSAAGVSNIATRTINVTSVNDAPTITPLVEPLSATE